MIRVSNDMIASKRDHTPTEILALKTLRNTPCLLKMHAWWVKTRLEEIRYYILTDYIDGGCLLDLGINSLNDDLLSQLAIEMLTVICKMHDNGILHRDVKSDNIMYDGAHFTLIDLGFASFIDPPINSCIPRATKSFMGSPFYVAPEIWKEGEVCSVDLKKSDIWSLGIVLYELKMKKMPYRSDSFDNLKKEVLEMNTDFVINCQCKLCRLISMMLTLDYRARPCSHDLLKWFMSEEEEEEEEEDPDDPGPATPEPSDHLRNSI